MRVVRRFQRPHAIARAVLLIAGQARGAAPTDSRVEPDAYQSAEADRWIVLRQAGAEGDEACDAFVAADVWEFDGCNGRAIGAGGGAGGGVEVWLRLVDGVCRSKWYSDLGCHEPL